MKNKLLNFLLATILVGTTSCATTIYDAPRNKEVQSTNILTYDFISAEDISISLEPPKKKGVEGLIETTDSYLGYIEFRQEYSDDAVDILEFLKKNKFDEANKLVMILSKKLGKDNNQYAQQYLEKIKEFEYTKRVFYSAEIGEGWEQDKNYTWDEIIMDIAGIPWQPFYLLFFKETSSGSYSKNVLKEKYYDEIRVRPYTGEEEVVRERVKVE
ncbi:MAG: hypothetical protein ABIH72_02550 [archaeon]